PCGFSASLSTSAIVPQGQSLQAAATTGFLAAKPISCAIDGAAPASHNITATLNKVSNVLRLRSRMLHLLAVAGPSECANGALACVQAQGHDVLSSLRIVSKPAWAEHLDAELFLHGAAETVFHLRAFIVCGRRALIVGLGFDAQPDEIRSRGCDDLRHLAVE